MMLSYLKQLFFANWRRKGLAIIIAVIAWVLVNKSIIIEKAIPNVPIEIINLPPTQTIEGLRYGNILERKVTLTLTGKKNVVEELNSDNLRVVLDVSDKDDKLIVKIYKNNLRSLDPDIDLKNNIKKVAHSEFKIQISPLISDRVPVIVSVDAGDPPNGYQFLEVWPQLLTQTITGPKRIIEKLKTGGLELKFDLQDITKKDLDAIQASSVGLHRGEIDFPVPESWKYVNIPLPHDHKEKLNSKDAENLKITFLRKELLSIPHNLPVSVFYGSKLTPKSSPLVIADPLQEKDGLIVLNMPLYIRDVSHLFLDVVKNNIEIVIMADSKVNENKFEWVVQFIDSKHLEDIFVKRSMTDYNFIENSDTSLKVLETHYRNIFHNYMALFHHLFREDGGKLRLDIVLKKDGIHLSI